MKVAPWLACVVLTCCISTPQGRAEWPCIHPKLKSNQVVIRKVMVLPAQVSYKKVRFMGVEGGTEEGEQIAAHLYSGVVKELTTRGVEVLPNPLDSAKTDADRYAIASLQTRYDTVAVQMRKHPGSVDAGRITLDDRVAEFAPGLGSDALVFVRGYGQSSAPQFSWSMVAFRVEATLVDARTGDVLALLRFEISRDVAKKTEEQLIVAFRHSTRDLPLPLPAPKK